MRGQALSMLCSSRGLTSKVSSITANCCECNQPQMHLSLLRPSNLWLPKRLFSRCPLSVHLLGFKYSRDFTLNLVASLFLRTFPELQFCWCWFMKCPGLRSVSIRRFMKQPLRGSGATQSVSLYYCCDSAVITSIKCITLSQFRGCVWSWKDLSEISAGSGMHSTSLK